jgi:hypothetical protein
VDTPGEAVGVAVSGDYAYVTDRMFGNLYVIDIRSPATPEIVGNLDTPGFAHDVALSGEYAYVAGGALYVAWQQCDDVTNVASELPHSVVSLHPARPNPFNPTTQIEFEIPAAQKVTVEIYDLRGRLVRSLVDKQYSAGTHHETWRGTDDSGNACAAGVYLVRMVSDSGVDSRKVCLVR